MLTVVISIPSFCVTYLQIQTYSSLEDIVMARYQISKKLMIVEIFTLVIIEICCMTIMISPVSLILPQIICGSIAVTVICIRTALLIVQMIKIANLQFRH